jgi:hypothetical protein
MLYSLMLLDSCSAHAADTLGNQVWPRPARLSHGDCGGSSGALSLADPQLNVTANNGDVEAARAFVQAALAMAAAEWGCSNDSSADGGSAGGRYCQPRV